MQQNYQDAMALVREFGFPDFFITMTANPAWPEVTQQLREWETAADRPDIVSRVFKLKLDELLRDLTQRGVLGKAIAHTWVVEFQKRGLPHARRRQRAASGSHAREGSAAAAVRCGGTWRRPARSSAHCQSGGSAQGQ